MITSYPSYYKDFACIADKCRHSCCIGWEIDIDADSLRRYEALEGPMGDCIRRGIDYTGTPHFRLTEGERCFFLRQDGLCQMYRELGEDALCQICTDHPRFRRVLPDRVEGHYYDAEWYFRSAKALLRYGFPDFSVGGDLTVTLEGGGGNAVYLDVSVSP